MGLGPHTDATTQRLAHLFVAGYVLMINLSGCGRATFRHKKFFLQEEEFRLFDAGRKTENWSFNGRHL